MKKIIFGLIATVFMSVLSINAQSQTKELKSVDFGIGLISPTYGDCIEGPSFCSRGTDLPTDFNDSVVAFAKSGSNTIKVLFSEKFYNENISDLRNGLVVEESTTIQLDLAKSIGFDKEFVVATAVYEITYRDGKYEATLVRK